MVFCTDMSCHQLNSGEEMDSDPTRRPHSASNRICVHHTKIYFLSSHVYYRLPTPGNLEITQNHLREHSALIIFWKTSLLAEPNLFDTVASWVSGKILGIDPTQKPYMDIMRFEPPKKITGELLTLFLDLHTCVTRP